MPSAEIVVVELELSQSLRLEEELECTAGGGGNVAAIADFDEAEVLSAGSQEIEEVLERTGGFEVECVAAVEGLCGFGVDLEKRELLLWSRTTAGVQTCLLRNMMAVYVGGAGTQARWALS